MHIFQQRRHDSLIYHGKHVQTSMMHQNTPKTAEEIDHMRLEKGKYIDVYRIFAFTEYTTTSFE